MSIYPRFFISKIFNFIFLLVLVALPILVVRYDVFTLHNNIPEQSATEYTEQLLLFLTSLLFVFLGIKHTLYRQGLFLVAGFFSCLFVRELDSFFDELFFHGFWIYPALLIAMITISYALLARKQTLASLFLFMKNHNFVVLCLGLSIIFVFSRLLGMGSMWHQILGNNYLRIIKNIIEETSELLGYTIIFYAAVNYYFSFSKQIQLK